MTRNYALAEQLANTVAARAADALEHLAAEQLANLARSLADGSPLEGYCSAELGAEGMLRALAYPTIVRELHRRAEVFELEGEG